MAGCNEVSRPIYDRIRVLLTRHEYDQWLHGTFGGVMGFQTRCISDELIEINRKVESKVKRRVALRQGL